MTVSELGAPGRKYRGAGPEQRQQQRRARLVDAAVEEFGTRGYRNTTIDAVCARAGVGKRYFYESFDGSESLLLAAYAVATDRLRGYIVDGALTSPGTVSAAVHSSLTGFFRGIAEDPRIARIAFFEILGVSPAVDADYRRVTGSFVDTFLELATPMIDIDSVPPPLLRTIATGLVGAVLTIAQQWVLDDYHQPLDAVVASTHTLLTSVLEGLSR
ncbi:TetR/AcrR family transcriptional regulator [Nocardia amikacinitolerans]|uniref:TetR/AcrR family transcriptional regulator n=1 Tax=Nocardia amikacinitolerans TaxID=756689 RepID=UPI0020A5861D|nr:TetR/AcrR family transcriptional regulator [Nocardia amikacinitolerans]MCP2287901.1 transcriptional regulator, TetR family [Nocardia amikacinitolerans]